MVIVDEIQTNLIASCPFPSSSFSL